MDRATDSAIVSATSLIRRLQVRVLPGTLTFLEKDFHMATDGPTPAPCNQKIYKHGEVVFVTHTIPSNAMEGWVKKVAERSGQPVDWHFFGGRAVVKALGDLVKVNEAIQ